MSGFDPNLMSSTSSFAGGSAMQDTGAIAKLTGSPNPFTAPVYDYSTQVSRSPMGNYLPTDTPQGNISAMDQQIKMAGAEAMQKQANPLSALMMGKQMLGQGQQQQQAPQMPQGQITKGQQVNVSDGITALLAPKLKKKQPISLL